jgi:CO/xanthine dehydrogenase FAD-binding subunit
MLNTEAALKLPAFAYHRAASLDEATDLLGRHGGDARVLAGGQSLLPVLALRMSAPALLVDITAAPDLAGHAVHSGRSVVLSAGVTARTAETTAEIAAAHPLLATALRQVGHVEIRTRGTVCGSVAHADPAAELPALLLALDGSVRVASAQRRRRVAAADFFLGPYTTALDDGELVAGVELPCPAPSAGFAVREITRRSGDFALVGVICVLDTDRAGTCTDARIALFGVSGTPRRATGAERVLTGERLTPEVLADAAAHAFDGIDVLGDLHGSTVYRTRAGRRLVEQSLVDAMARCTEVAHA